MPSAIDDFKAVEYWDSFFKARADKGAFEWFCSCEDLLPLIADDLGGHGSGGGVVLHIGSGNSDLGAALAQRWRGVAVLNVDYSRVGLEELASHDDRRDSGSSSGGGGIGGRTQEYLVADALRLPLRPSSCACAVDKGLVDAMMTSDDAETRGRCSAVFSEVGKALTSGAPLHLVSLAQDHILALLAHVGARVSTSAPRDP